MTKNIWLTKIGSIGALCISLIGFSTPAFALHYGEECSKETPADISAANRLCTDPNAACRPGPNPGPDGKQKPWYCMNASFNCAFPGIQGQFYGASFCSGLVQFTCMNPDTTNPNSIARFAASGSGDCIPKPTNGHKCHLPQETYGACANDVDCALQHGGTCGL